MDIETTIKNEAIWKPIIIKKQEVIRHSEGVGKGYERNYYHYTTLEQEKFYLYNEATGEIKANLVKTEEDK